MCEVDLRAVDAVGSRVPASVRPFQTKWPGTWAGRRLPESTVATLLRAESRIVTVTLSGWRSRMRIFAVRFEQWQTGDTTFETSGP